MRNALMTAWVVLCIVGGLLYGQNKDQIPKDAFRFSFESSEPEEDGSVVISVEDDEGKKTIIRVPKTGFSGDLDFGSEEMRSQFFDNEAFQRELKQEWKEAKRDWKKRERRQRRVKRERRSEAEAIANYRELSTPPAPPAPPELEGSAPPPPPAAQ